MPLFQITADAQMQEWGCDPAALRRWREVYLGGLG
jgi:hypothetical protein